jgi:hypothetical protein
MENNDIEKEENNNIQEESRSQDRCTSANLSGQNSRPHIRIDIRRAT